MLPIVDNVWISRFTFKLTSAESPVLSGNTEHPRLIGIEIFNNFPTAISVVLLAPCEHKIHLTCWLLSPDTFTVTSIPLMTTLSQILLKRCICNTIIRMVVLNLCLMWLAIMGIKLFLAVHLNFFFRENHPISFVGGSDQLTNQITFEWLVRGDKWLFIFIWPGIELEKWPPG